MSNYPPNVSATCPSAPWNKQRSAEDIQDEMEQLRLLHRRTEMLQLELSLTDGTDEIFSSAALAAYDASNPVDMLNAMLDIIRLRLTQLEAE